MATNSQNTMPIVAETVPADRQCLRNGTDVVKLVEDFCRVGSASGNSGASFPTQDSAGAQALQLAQQNAAGINLILGRLNESRFADVYGPVPAGSHEFAISWTNALSTTNYLVSLSFLAKASASLSSGFNWWIVAGSQTTTGFTIHFENAPALSVGLNFAWTVTSPPNAIAALPVISNFNPASAAVGATVSIYGNNFVGVTEVDFNGTSASFTAITDTYLTATVPVGATTGAIAVQTSIGTAISASSFTVV